MSTTAELAASLYGPDPTPGPSTMLGDAQPSVNSQGAQDVSAEVDQPAQPATADELVDALYGDPEPLPEIEVPDNIKALRDEDQVRKFYSPLTSFMSIIPDNALDVPELADVPADLKQAVVHEMREVVADLGLSPNEVGMLKIRAGMASRAETAPEAQIEEAITRMNAAFGQDATKALRDARALVARDPRVAQWIERTGLGNDPEVVVTLAHAARSQRAKGRL